MPDDSTRTEISQVSFETLKLRPGSALKIHHSTHEAPHGEVQLLGAVRGKSLMVALKALKQGWK